MNEGDREGIEMTASNCTWCKICANCPPRPVYHTAASEPEGRSGTELIKDDRGNSTPIFSVFFSNLVPNWQLKSGEKVMQRRGGLGAGVLVAIVMAGFALFRYFGSTTINAVTGEKQHVNNISAGQEIALGLQAAPELSQQYGGASGDAEGQQLVERVGNEVMKGSAASKTPYKFQFHLLADQKTINAFALPGGQVFITEALLHKLKTEGQLAGVLGHEVGHVVARHGAEQIAKQQLTQGLTGAAVLATYDPNNPSSRGSAAVAAIVGNLVNMKFGRQDELEADKLGVRFMAEAGYDPRSMLSVMQVLKDSAGGGRTPEFFSTHPNPDNRTAKIKQAIEQSFPGGVPGGLKK